MLGAVVSLVANALAVIVVARFLPNQIGYDSWTNVGIFALVAGVLNAVLRPIVNALTAPIGCITLGLFSIVVNGLMFYLAAQIDRVGVEATFLGATIAALAAGVLNGALGWLTRERR